MYVILMYWAQDDGKALLRACMSNDWNSAERQIQSGSYLEARDEVHSDMQRFSYVVQKYHSTSTGRKNSTNVCMSEGEKEHCHDVD